MVRVQTLSPSPLSHSLPLSLPLSLSPLPLSFSFPLSLSLPLSISLSLRYSLFSLYHPVTHIRTQSGFMSFGRKPFDRLTFWSPQSKRATSTKPMDCYVCIGKTWSRLNVSRPNVFRPKDAKPPTNNP
jgi:hypothetical protein